MHMCVLWNLRNFEITLRKLAICATIYELHKAPHNVNYLPMEQAFANETRERLSSALECRYGLNKLRS